MNIFLAKTIEKRLSHWMLILNTTFLQCRQSCWGLQFVCSYPQINQLLSVFCRLGSENFKLRHFCCILGEAVLSACKKACGLIDMRTHIGVHPCMGAVDLIPIYPLGEEVGVEDCAKEAQGEILYVHACMWACMYVWLSGHGHYSCILFCMLCSTCLRTRWVCFDSTQWLK